MFYDIKNQSLKYDDIFLKDTTLQNEEGDFTAQDTYFLNACDDELLKELGFAKVKEEPLPSFDEKTQELIQKQSYDEEANVFILSYEIKEKDIEELKELKIEEINTQKEEILNGGFSFKDKIYQSTNEDQLRINGAVTNALVNPITHIEWIAQDNTITKFSVDEFKIFASSMAYFVQETIFKALNLKEQARKATSKEELDLITWDSKDE